MGVSDRLEHCPVAGCFCGAGQGHPGFGKEALKAHIDSHLLGITLGQVPLDWMRNRGWVICPHCNKSASGGRRGGVHDSCAAEARTLLNNAQDGWAHLEDGWEQGGWAAKLRRLPHMGDIFKALVYTREFTHRGLLPLYRQEFGRLCANVVCFNRMDAWDHLGMYGGITDSVNMKRARVAWIEWAMFAKCVLRAESKGVRPAHAYARAKNRLEQWIGGERESLWRQVMLEDRRACKKQKRKGGITDKASEQ